MFNDFIKIYITLYMFTLLFFTVFPYYFPSVFQFQNEEYIYLNKSEKLCYFHFQQKMYSFSKYLHLAKRNINFFLKTRNFLNDVFLLFPGANFTFHKPFTSSKKHDPFSHVKFRIHSWNLNFLNAISITLRLKINK